MKFEFIPHTADLKFKAYGKTKEEAFENAALALISIIAKDNQIKPRKGKPVQIHGRDTESLLYNFLEEIISLLDTDNFITAKASVTFLGNNIKAELVGDDADNYRGLDVVKAPTYADMHIKQNKTGWEIQCVVDV